CLVVRARARKNPDQMRRKVTMNDQISLQNKVALVTGAGGGIGQEIAHAFAHAGGQIVIADRDAAKANTVAEDLTRMGRTAIGITVDVTSESQVETGIESAVSAF